MPAEWRFSVEGQSGDQFDMRLSYTDGPYDGIPFQRPFSETDFRIDLDGISASNRRLAPSDFPTDQIEKKSQAITLEYLENVGGRLFDSLFKGDGAEYFANTYRLLKSNPGRIAAGGQEDENFLNIWLDSKRSAQLGGVPWEILFDRENDGTFLATDKSCNIVRRLDPFSPGKRPPPPEETIRMLVATANPHADLDSGTEVANIERQLNELMEGADKRLEIRQLTEADRRELSDTINEFKPHIFHYIGHGDFKQDTGLISLHRSSDPALSDPVDAQTIKQMMLNHPPWLVVLNSCLGGAASRYDPFAGAAQALRQIDIPFVVAMQYSISDDAAIRFSQRLYSELAMRTPIAPAVSSARSAIRELEDPLSRVELITPVLYASSQLHRIPLPPLIMVPGAGALAADETAVQSNDSATLRDGGKERNWLAIIGVATGVVSAVTGVIALVLTNFAEQSDPSPPPFISATPAPMPSPTPTDAYQENGGDNGDPAGMEAGGGERGADGGGGTGGSQGSQTSYSIGNPPPVGGCPDGAERDEDGICPEDFGVFPLEEAIDQRDPSDERVPYEPRFFPSPVPVPPPAPPPAPPPPSPIPQCQFGPYIVFFDPDEATLTPVAAQILRQAIDAYASCGGRDLTLAGHTDTAGSLSENIELAGDRAKRVQDFLIAYGVPAGRISTEAFGESMPRIPTADGVREGQNNRVVLTAAPGVSPPADQVRAAEEYRTARFSVNSRIDTINRLRAEIDRSNSTVLGWPVVTRALDNSERDTLVEAARELLARDAPAPVSEIYRAAAEPLTDIADELLPYAQDLNRLLRAIASYNQSRQILDRDTAGLSRFLEADLRRLAPLLDDDAQGRMADTERSNRRVMGEAANGSMAAINDIEEATQRLINARNDTRDALSQYRRASNMRAKRLRRDFRLIDRAVTAARDVSLEITSPYQRAEDEVLARCLGEQMKLSLAETAIEFAQYPTNSDWFRFQRGGRLNCDDTETETVSSIAARSQAELEEMREDGPLPVLAERIIVETKKRRFTAPESGIVPLGAHRELRLRLDGAESLAFDERSVRLEPQAIRTINRIANWLDDYNQSLWSLPPIACEPGEECGDASTKPMALVIEAAINPSKSPELSKKAAGVRLDSILRQLRQSARFDLEVTAIICKSPWHESENGTDVVNLSLVPGGMEIMLDQCAPIQDVTFNLDGQNEE